MPKQVLTSVNRDKILRIIDGWSGKLTWDKLCAKVVEMTDLESVHRSTLDGDDEIYDAWKNKKAELAKLKDDPKGPSPTIESLLEEVEELESKNTRLERKLNLYKQKFVRWLYNMQNMPALDFEKIEQEIDNPLPEVNRK